MIQASNPDSSARRLIVFTRCPEIGRCKTRLISAFGERKATLIHELLVRRTMSWMKCAIDKGVTVEVRYAGDDLASLKLLCGEVADRLCFRPQQQGDLGQRLSHASSSAFQEGALQVAIIGTDCPYLTHHFILKAFEALGDADLVLGPATDGGYYLIASAKYYADLFTDIVWSGEKVLDDTLHKASRLELTVELLECLTDVDHPKDVNSLLREISLPPESRILSAKKA
ncbi:MAG: TIGR04282 family arsenosugar biosynthesis glycosyltransferase [Pirellulales bacterium]